MSHKSHTKIVKIHIIIDDYILCANFRNPVFSLLGKNVLAG